MGGGGTQEAWEALGVGRSFPPSLSEPPGSHAPGTRGGPGNGSPGSAGPPQGRLGP